MKKLAFLLTTLIISNSVLAFDVVYPKKNDVTINSNSTFFIGSSECPLKINGKDVPLHSSGGFAYVVNLNEGKNTFILQSEKERKIFVITRPVVKPQNNNVSQFIPYKEKKYFYVTTENSPLRSTPVDFGINRIAHLQRNIPLIADGEKNGFYRIILDEKKSGWISKSDVKAFQNFEIKYANLSGYDYIDSNEYFTFVFHLDKMVPFEITESESLNLKLYNVNPDKVYTMDFPYKDAISTRKLLGYSGYYEGNNFVWKIRKPIITNNKKPLKNLKIAIDPGHGGSEIGSIGCLGHKEKDLNLQIAKHIEDELKKRGAKVFMTRTDDIYVGLKDRVENSNREKAVVLLSIHGNALPDGADPNKNSGTSIYYYYDQAKPLAENIMDSVTRQTGVNNDKIRQASFAMVRNTNALSLLIETSYLINPSDNANLINEEFQKNYAKAVVDGLETYFSK